MIQRTYAGESCGCADKYFVTRLTQPGLNFSYSNGDAQDLFKKEKPATNSVAGFSFGERRLFLRLGCGHRKTSVAHQGINGGIPASEFSVGFCWIH